MSNERFVRWQGHTMAQLSTALALLSGLSLAALGFLFSLARESSFKVQGYSAVLYLVALAFFFIASSASVAAVVTRLLDFKLTANKVRGAGTEEPLTLFGTTASGYGKATWRLFWVVVGSFAVAVVAAAASLSSVYLGSVIRAAGF